jgi:hypothetical protein
MAAQRDRVYPDTATLYPISIADLILRLAELGIIELLWTDYLLAEVTRVLVEDKGLSKRAATYFCDCIRKTFPDNRIPKSTYEHLLATRTGPDPDDHEHSAAASAARADIIVSADKKGFPFKDTKPARRRHPDAYLTSILRRFPTETVGVLRDMGHDRREPTTTSETLEALSRAGLRTFAVRATELLQSN